MTLPTWRYVSSQDIAQRFKVDLEMEPNQY